MTFQCVFCRRRFDELPFYGCCGACYTGNPVVRAVVDEAHPQPTEPLYSTTRED